MVSTRSREKEANIPGESPRVEETPCTSNSPRDHRRRLRENLRTRSTGLGLTIRTDSVAKNKRVTFEEEDDEGFLAGQGKETISSEISGYQDPEEADFGDHYMKGSDDDDDDSLVEEVSTAATKRTLEKDRSLERETIKFSALQNKKRKRRKKQETLEEDFDETFFEQLAAEKTEQQQEIAKLRSKAVKRQHINFVVSTDDDLERKPLQVNDGIQVVVLGEKCNGPSVSAEAHPGAATPVSLLFARGQLHNGIDVVSEKQKQKAKQAGLKKVQQQGWVRSKKMNRLLLPGAKSNRKHARTAPPVHFVVNM